MGSIKSNLSPRTITDRLRGAGYLSQAEIESAECDILHSGVSNVARLKLNFSPTSESIDIPPTLILKVPTDSRISNRGRWEVFFYNVFVPMMKLPYFATRFDSHYAHSTTEYHLILEDLAETHYGITHPLPPRKHESEAIVTCLADIHAFWWNNSQIEG